MLGIGSGCASSVQSSQNDSNRDKCQFSELRRMRVAASMRRCEAGSHRRDVVASVFDFRNIDCASCVQPSNICGGYSCSQNILRSDWSRLRFFRPPLWLRLRLRSKDALPQSSSTPRAETPAKPVQEQSANEWRASKVIGLYVYNDANERLGSINEVLMDSSGKINKAVIGVGGFLGIGESNIAVNFDQLKFVNEPMRTATTTAAPATGRPATVRARSARPRRRPRRRRRRSRASILIMPSSA